MQRNDSSPWLTRYAWSVAAATGVLIWIGGLVTSHGAGMAVPDWPTSYGYNMFALPIHLWTGGVFYEHTHRLWATLVGTLVVFLTRWLGGSRSRLPLALVGAVEMAAGFALLGLQPELKAAGHFLTGIGGVVLAAAAVWARNEPAAGCLPALGWTAFGLVQLQGLLGGLRVVWLAAGIGVFHGMLAQGFLVLVTVIALFTTRWWRRQATRRAEVGGLRGPFWVATALIFTQLALGAAMRHRHAGLAVPDFPLAYGRVWPRLDADAIARYNQQRLETVAAQLITATDVVLHMAHRLGACLVLGAVGVAFVRTRRRLPAGHPARRGAAFWLGLVLVQCALGALTVWTNKAADVATAHVAVGSLALVTGGLLCVFAGRRTGVPAPASAGLPESLGAPASAPT